MITLIAPSQPQERLNTRTRDAGGPHIRIKRSCSAACSGGTSLLLRNWFTTGACRWTSGARQQGTLKTSSWTGLLDKPHSTRRSSFCHLPRRASLTSVDNSPWQSTARRERRGGREGWTILHPALAAVLPAACGHRSRSGRNQSSSWLVDPAGMPGTSSGP